MTTPELKRGQAISFRIPSDTPDYLLKQMQKLKSSEGRNFSRKIAEYVIQGVSESIRDEGVKEVITIPLPHVLTEEQRDWLKHEHSEIILGSIIYQLLEDPERTMTLFTALNSHSNHVSPREETIADDVEGKMNQDDIDTFQFKTVSEREEQAELDENDDDEVEALLGDFLSEMNK